MPEPLEAELILNTDTALQNVTALGQSASDAMSEAADAFETAMATAVQAVPAITLDVDADTEGVTDTVQGSLDAVATTLAVDADASEIPDQVQGALDQVEAPTIPISVDDHDANATLDEINRELGDLSGVIELDSTQVDDAADKMLDLNDATQESVGNLAAGAKETTGFAGAQDLLSGSAEVAAGHLVGVGTAAAGLGLGEAAIGVAGLGAAFGTFVENGIDAVATAQRFDSITGKFASDVKNINVGNLNRDLGELAITLGTDDEALLNSSATLFKFAQNFGATGKEAANFSNIVDAMAARAVALNPSLGSVADVADRMLKVFATGRDKALIPYAIALDKTEISARASAIAQDAGRDAATRFDTAMAVAQLSAEKYGGALSHDVAEGAVNATIQQRSLHEELNNILEDVGKPLVAPFLEAFRASLPDIQALAEVFGRFGASILPLVVDVLKVAAPIIESMGTAAADLADSLDLILSPLHDVSGGAQDAGEDVGVLGKAFGFVQDTVDPLTRGMHLVSAGSKLVQGDFGDAAEEFGRSLPIIGGVIGLFDEGAPALSKFAQAQKDAGEAQQRATELAGEGKTNTEAYRNAVNEAAEANRIASGAQQQVATDIANTNEAQDFAIGVHDALTPKVLEGVAALSQEADEEARLTDEANKANDALFAQFDHQIAAEQASLAAQDAVKKLADAERDAAAAGGQNAEKNEEQQKALLDAESAALRAAAAIGQKAADDNASLGPTEAQRAKTEAQISFLQGLAGTLAEGSPLRTALEGYIGRLQAVPDAKDTQFALDFAGVDWATLERLIQRINDLRSVSIGLGNVAFGNVAPPGYHFDPVSGQLVEGAAEGMIVYPRPGGTQVTVGEAGATEVILPTDNPARAWELLVQSGLAAQLGPEYDKLFQYLGGTQFLAGINAASEAGGGGGGSDPFAPPYATSGDLASIQSVDALKGIISQAGLTMLGAGDTSEQHWFEDNTGITDNAYQALWGHPWAYYAKGGFTDWPESEGRLAMLHGQETILNREQMRGFMNDLVGAGVTLPRYGGSGREFGKQVVNYVTVDQHSNIDVDARGQPDGTKIGLAMSRRYRADVHAMRRVELPV